MGVNANASPLGKNTLGKNINLNRWRGAWPNRTLRFLNEILGGEIFHVDYSMTLGGTNSLTATKIWDYSLMPNGVPYPDIIIHGYATNDMHAISIKESEQRGISLEDMILDVNQKFIRQVLTPKIPLSSS